MNPLPNRHEHDDGEPFDPTLDPACATFRVDLLLGGDCSVDHTASQDHTASCDACRAFAASRSVSVADRVVAELANGALTVGASPLPDSFEAVFEEVAPQVSVRAAREVTGALAADGAPEVLEARVRLAVRSRVVDFASSAASMRKVVGAACAAGLLGLIWLFGAPGEARPQKRLNLVLVKTDGPHDCLIEPSATCLYIAGGLAGQPFGSADKKKNTTERKR